MAAPSVEAALREAERMVAGRPSNQYDEYLATYGAEHPDLAGVVGRPGQVAVRANGPYYSPSGAREGYEVYNIPPVLRQSNPFATAGYRTFVDPFGQMMVQPLVGFPSAYPHVLSGVPTNPFYGYGMAAQLGSLGFPFGFGMWPQMPMMQGGGAPAPARSGGGSTRRSAPTKTPQRRIPFFYGDTDTMPNPAVERARAARAQVPNAPVAQAPVGAIPTPWEAAYDLRNASNLPLASSPNVPTAPDPGLLGQQSAYYEATPPPAITPQVSRPNEPDAMPIWEEWGYNLPAPEAAPDPRQLAIDEYYYNNTRPAYTPVPVPPMNIQPDVSLMPNVYTPNTAEPSLMESLYRPTLPSVLME